MAGWFCVIFVVRGAPPEQLVALSRGTLTEDEDPSNIPPTTYLPILLGMILLAILAVAIGLVLL